MNDKEQIVTTPEGLLVRAPAKINLSLLVAGKRPDSFHEIESLIAKIAWYDEILIQPGPGPGGPNGHRPAPITSFTRPPRNFCVRPVEPPSWRSP